MRLRAQSPGRVAQLLEQHRERTEGVPGVCEVVDAVVVGRAIHLQGAGRLQHGPLEHALEGVQPADLLLRLHLHEARAQEGGHRQMVVVHVGGGRGVGEDVAAAVVPQQVVALAAQSPRLRQHVAHHEDSVGPGLADPPVPVEAGPGLHALVMEMVLDEQEGFGQATALLGVATGPVGSRNLVA